MQRHYAKAFSALEQKRESLFSQINRTEQSFLIKSVNRGKWSILQICYHLLLSEQLSVLYLQKKLHYRSNIFNRTWFSEIRFRIFITVLRLPISIPAPKRVAVFPHDLKWTDISREWIGTRKQMKEILENVSDQDIDKLLYYHPSAGRLTLEHMLIFFMVHFDRHRAQIDRLLLEQDQNTHNFLKTKEAN